MKIGFLVLGVLILSTALWAQTLPCVSSWSASDNTCDGQCGSTTIFQPVCTGYHCVQAHIVCNGGGSTEDCKFSFKILNSTDNTTVIQWRNWDEEPGRCFSDVYGPNRNEFYMEQHKTYKMSICLEGSCPGHTCDCTHCFAEIIVNSN